MLSLLEHPDHHKYAKLLVPRELVRNLAQTCRAGGEVPARFGLPTFLLRPLIEKTEVRHERHGP
jgi:hypothetical protein